MSASTLPVLALPVGGTLRVQDRALCSVHLADGSTLDAPNLVRVDEVVIGAGAKLNAPNLASCTALRLGPSAKHYAPHLKLAADLLLGVEAVFDAPALESLVSLVLDPRAVCATASLRKITEGVTLAAGCCLDAPSLEEIQGTLRLQGAVVAIPGLKTVGLMELGVDSRLVAQALCKCGDIYAEKGAILNAAELVWADTVYLGASAAIDLPALHTIKGDLGLGESARLYARELQEIEGDAHFSAGSFGVTERIPAIVGTMDQGSIATPWLKPTPTMRMRV